jgi:hypothetical protein
MNTEKLNCLDQVNHLGSSKFGFISSSNLVAQLEKSGLQLDKLVEMKIRKNKEVRQGFQKHRMLFNTGMKTKDGQLQLLVTNSHEGSTALRFQLGFWRMVCSNGLVIGKSIVTPVTLRHTLENAGKINDTIEMILDQKNKVFESIESLQSKKWNAEQLQKFTNEALKIRGYSEKLSNVLPMFEVKRAEDQASDAFSVFNVVQENIIRTGFNVVNENGKISKLRAIKSLDEQNRINSELWDLAVAS